MAKIEEIFAIADGNGFGEAFRSLVHMAERHGLIVRPHEKSIRFAPPQDRRHYLLTIWANPPGENGGIQYDIYPDGFVKFYGVSQEEATRLLGDTGQYEVEEIALTDIPKLIRAIDTLLSNTSENSNHSTYLLTWNPGKSDWMNFAEDWENVYLGNRPLVEWSCGNTRQFR